MRVTRPARSLVAGLLVAAWAAAPGAAPAHAEHGGQPIGSMPTCSRPLDPPRCTSVGNDRWHYVYLDPSLPPELADALRIAMRQYSRTYLVMVEQPRVTPATDAIVVAGDAGQNGAAGWVNCPPDARQGLNGFGHRWCQRQEVHFNLNPRYHAFFADAASRLSLACHELGHTVGLRHWGNPPRSQGPAAATCMQPDVPDGPTDLHAWDRDHLNEYYASPRSRPVDADPGTLRRRAAYDADLRGHLLGDVPAQRRVVAGWRPTG